MKMNKEEIIELADPLMKTAGIDEPLIDQTQKVMARMLDALAEDIDPLSALSVLHVYGGAAVQLEATLKWPAKDAENLAMIAIVRELVSRAQDE